MTDRGLAVASTAVDLPDGAVPICSVSVVAYMSDDGHEAVAWAIHGDPDLLTVSGMMTMATHQIIRDNNDEE